MYKKAHLVSDFRKKISLAGARTHESETRPEEIYGNERVGEISELQILDFSVDCWEGIVLVMESFETQHVGATTVCGLLSNHKKF